MGKDKNVDYKKLYENLLNEFDEFVYIVSHDLKAPLRAISTLTEWIVEDIESPSEEVLENIELLKSRTDRVTAMLEGVLEFSRVERKSIAIETTNVSELINKVIKMYRADNVTFTVEGDWNEFDTYQDKLYFVIQHIVKNGIDFNSKEQKIIKFKLEEKDEFNYLTISDNGDGLREAEIPKIFKLFYTVRSKDEFPSTGMGLTLVKKILEFVGGEITITSKEKVGTEVCIKWPK